MSSTRDPPGIREVHSRSEIHTMTMGVYSNKKSFSLFCLDFLFKILIMPDPFIHAFVRICTHDRDAKVSGHAQKDSAYIRTFLCMLAT